MPTTLQARRTGGPALRVMTLADAMLHLRLDEAEAGDEAQDAYVLGLVDTATQACETRTERALIDSTWLGTADALDASGLLLPWGPVLEVLAVTYVDADGATQTLPATDWQLDDMSDPERILPAPGVTWPAVQAGRAGAVRVTWRAGYGTEGDSPEPGAAAVGVPAPLVHWIKLLMTDMHSHRGQSSDRPAQVQAFSDGLLQPWRRLGC